MPKNYLKNNWEKPRLGLAVDYSMLRPLTEGVYFMWLEIL
jgi:hypothetical protein